MKWPIPIWKKMGNLEALYGYEKMGTHLGNWWWPLINMMNYILGFERSEINNLQLRLCDAFFNCGKWWWWTTASRMLAFTKRLYPITSQIIFHNISEKLFHEISQKSSPSNVNVYPWGMISHLKKGMHFLAWDISHYSCWSSRKKHFYI